MATRTIYTCNGCGAEQVGRQEEGRDWPPEGWTEAWGYPVHACSAACWERVQHGPTGKMYLPAAAYIPPASFTLFDQQPDVDVPLTRRPQHEPPPDPPPTKPTRLVARYIYAVQAGDGGPVKIGVSKSPEERMRSLQIGCGETLRLLGKAPGSPKGEKLIHAMFAEHRRHGEWFEPHPDLLRFIQTWSSL